MHTYHSADLLAAWATDPLYKTGAIDGLGNLALSYSLAIDENYAQDNFVIRFTPIPVQ